MAGISACFMCASTASFAASMNSSIRRCARLRGARLTPVISPNWSNSISGSGRSKSIDPRRTRFLLSTSASFFFQAEDGIRDADVTGVQTCALPIYIQLGSQDANEHDSGAHTGEHSLSLLHEAGASVILVGHSERRQFYGDNAVRIAAKVADRKSVV